MALFELGATSLTCSSRYHPRDGAEPALLDLQWSTTMADLFLVVRSEDVIPTQTGTFIPFATVISRGSDSWIGAMGKCRLSVTASTKIGEEPFSATHVRESYKVAGTVACDQWFPARAGEVLERFEFATRAKFVRPR